MKDEYVISIKITTDKPLKFNDIPNLIEDEVIKGSAVILTAEPYESWKEEQAAR